MQCACYILIHTRSDYVDSPNAYTCICIQRTSNPCTVYLYVHLNIHKIVYIATCTVSIPVSVVSYNRGHKVQMSNCQSSVVKDSCIALGSGRNFGLKNSITLQWDSEILPYENTAAYTVDIILYEVNTATNSLNVLRTLYSNVANSGAWNVTIPVRTVQSQTGRIRDAPAIAVVLKVAANKPLQQAGVWTGIMFLAGRSAALRHECRLWDIEDDGMNDIRVLPCPPMVNQARLPNSGLVEESYESIYGSTTYHQQFISTFHPGAQSCFRQRER